MKKFLIISHVVHKRNCKGQIGGYGPYIREMNIWLKYVDTVEIVAPIIDGEFDPIDLPYEHACICFTQVPVFRLLTTKDKLLSFFLIPYIGIRILIAMGRASHIHLRCPGNMGLLGAVLQMFFPYKQKTAKYAGNWDLNSKQPVTYRWQQKIMRNVFLTHRMQVLVYGDWPDKNKNILPFFTATYRMEELEPVPLKDLTGEINLLFVGTLSAGKRPLLSVEATKLLVDRGVRVQLHLLGEGIERAMIEKYVTRNHLESIVHLHGNVDAKTVLEYYKKSHFLLFASQSEGWPKAVAEAMCWECLPITTRVSCVPQMLGNGTRGTLVSPDANSMVEAVCHYIGNEMVYEEHKKNASSWSREYTLEKFETEIRKLL